MDGSARMALVSALRALSWIFFALAGFAFVFGDFIIRAYTGADVVLGLMEDFGPTLLLGGVGFLAMLAKDRLEEGGTPLTLSLGETLRK